MSKLLKKPLLVCFLMTMALCGCSKKETKNTATATFYLEGGVCLNAKEKLLYIYDLPDENASTYIADPNSLVSEETKKITRYGYFIEGWYQTKNEDNGVVSYSDPWNFTTDKMTKDGVTLYANWEKVVTYTFDVCYFDENGEEKVLKSYTTKEGSTFESTANTICGNPNLAQNKTALVYKDDAGTIIGLKDENGNPFDLKTKHPGGEVSTTVKIYVDILNDEFRLIKDSKDLVRYKTKNLFLINDIDMEGEEFSIFEYKGIIEGNGHKISNFVIDYSTNKTNLTSSYDGSGENGFIYASIFSKLKGATIKNVTFENSINIKAKKYTGFNKFVFNSLAGSITDSIISNVKIVTDLTIDQDTDQELELNTTTLSGIINESEIDNSTIDINVKVTDNR